jgi:hypothetical protein
MAKRMLYLTVDGLLEPLGFSQVVRVVELLAKRGRPYDIISLEREKDLAQEHRVRDLRVRLAKVGIGWTHFAFRSSGGSRDAVANEAQLVSCALAHVARGTTQAIHARSYHGAMAALVCKTVKSVPYVFDARSYWFDERLEEGKWLTTPVKVGFARGIERQLYAQAAGVVTLTELQAEDVRGGKFGTQPQAICIPTLADFDDFQRRAVTPSVPASLEKMLRAKKVVGIVGSINRSYLVDETLELAQKFLQLDLRHHLLVLSQQHEEYARRFEARGLKKTQWTVISARHETMPDWLSLMDWGMLLLNPTSPAKRASMPTKLGEFFASGVRPIQYGCNAEVAAWVKKAGTGLCLSDVTPKSLQQAASEMQRPRNELVVMQGREVAAAHFSLVNGVAAYERFLQCVI